MRSGVVGVVRWHLYHYYSVLTMKVIAHHYILVNPQLQLVSCNTLAIRSSSVALAGRRPGDATDRRQAVLIAIEATARHSP